MDKPDELIIREAVQSLANQGLAAPAKTKRARRITWKRRCLDCEKNLQELQGECVKQSYP